MKNKIMKATRTCMGWFIAIGLPAVGVLVLGSDSVTATAKRIICAALFLFVFIFFAICQKHGMPGEDSEYKD